MPKKEVYVKFATLIEDLSEKYGSKLFEPHVTVLGDIAGDEQDVIAKAHIAVTGHKPFEVNLTSAGYTNEFFRQLFVKAEKSEQLFKLHKDARKVYGMPSKDAYAPHLSLLYGEHPTATKEETIKEIGKDFGDTFMADAIYVVLSSKDVPIEEWNVVEGIPFRK